MVAGRTWAHMDKIFDGSSTNLESWPPGNSTNFDVKPELPQGATQAGQALAGLTGTGQS